MKKIKTDTVILDLKGKPVRNSDNTADFTIGELISNVLSGKVSNPHKGYMFAKKFSTQKVVELLAEDVVFIKTELERNGKAEDWGYNALLTGQGIEILDSTEEEKK